MPEVSVVRRTRRPPSGLLAAAAAGLFALVGLAYGDWTHPVALAIELAICLAAGSSGRWLVGGGIATGLMLALLMAVPLDAARFSTLTVTIVVLVASSGGRWALLALFTAWYVPILAVIEAGGFAPLASLLAAASAWLFVLALCAGAGWFVHRQLRAWESLERDHSLSLQAQRRAIARDLHDTVAQATTSIVVRAEAAKLRPATDPELVADLDYIATVGRNGLRDLRGLLTAMRSEEGDSTANVGLRNETFAEVLDRQVAELTAAGFDVRVLVQADVTALPESIRYTLNHVISEASNNVLRHARPGSDCAFMVGASAQELEVLVSNEVGGRSTVPTNRFGLIGLSERVGALGGTLEVVSRAPKWVLRVRLPLIGQYTSQPMEEDE
jgi:signal transduction histidine kinase